MSEQAQFTHFDASGNARMVDVSEKGETVRQAIAAGTVTLSRQAFDMVRKGSMKKGDVLGVARIAGIMAAKKVDQLIPLCHPLMITAADIVFSFDDQQCSIQIEATVSMTGRTGVEMEALTAVSVAALTIYDMCKAIDKSMVISDICLLRKSGGKSGLFVRPAVP
ncbi:GTP cyclohydrolase subunit MoaC [Desulfobulbus propionicus DSM 2032]|jgi:cyclic pyranopterin phosphate synthase|uniref:Cyclic pyranopterin monophosphate synthase n=1 Tax=Desulfobulbus propionicus (strain ATCC 33891 / DSM 2032 / VKM B-1956 / 1pr3) TaxID=577650 RepID=A0A7U4DPG9_DESPD|nr:cyclic pyranopterin monophosphate synthase MoaC [Desulfobulbus propionicus]ADW18121.1 GTP cyclohydrolase subunit MoaC [Desulfobulbus propionicus DSM 2032]